MPINVYPVVNLWQMHLRALLNRSSLIAEASVWPIQSDGRPQRMKAVIREDECIGCTKCISACPVDAIIGSGKLMHTRLDGFMYGLRTLHSTMSSRLY